MPPVESNPPQRKFSASLFETYLGSDISQIYYDMKRRPDHYEEDQRKLLEDIESGVVGIGSVDNRLINDLVLTYFQKTNPARMVKQAVASFRNKGVPERRRPVVFESQTDDEVIV